MVFVGRNYARRAKGLNNPVPTEPLLFSKPGSCVVPVEGGFKIPTDRGSVHYGEEIAVLLGKSLSTRPTPEEVLDAISGYAPALDLTLRDLQAKLKEKGLPWELAKCFDGDCVLPPFVSASSFEDTTAIPVRCTGSGGGGQGGRGARRLRPRGRMVQEIASWC